jgi:hypothetical protein
MAQSLQIKRNKNIFNTKEDAVNHLKSLVNKLEDGEIVLCRYFNGDSIQTLIGIETKYGVLNENTKEEDIISTITHFDSFDEIGNGLLRDDKGKLHIKIDDTTINFLTNSENGLKVSNMHANVTTTTEDIVVVGGPLVNKDLQDILTETDSLGNKIIKAGTNVQDLLFTLFCKEVYPLTQDKINGTISGFSGSVTSTINSPILSITCTVNGKKIDVTNNLQVEVGTTISANTISFNGNSIANVKNSYVSGITYGYSLTNDNIKDFSGNTITKIPSTNHVSSAVTTIKYTLTNFSTTEKNVSKSGTTLQSFSDVNLGQVIDGDNKIVVNVTGQPISYSCEEINSVYVCSNVGKTSEKHKTPKVDGFSGTTIAPISSTTMTVKGVRYGFYGIIIDDPNVIGQETFEYTSTNIRNLTPLISPQTFTVKGDKVGRVIIAIPNSWGKEIDKITDSEQMGTDLWDSSIGYVTTSYDENINPNGMREIDVNGANEYSASKYKVYTFNPGQPISINQTVTFKK